MNRFHAGIRKSVGLIALLLTLTTCMAHRTHPGRISEPRAAVARIWHGRTSQARADEYAAYLQQAGILKIRSTPGNLGAQMFRRSEGLTEEFIVISYWESREVIKGFAGADIEKTHHLPRDPEFLVELEPRVRHYDVVINEWASE